jgi:hypothetical protein
VDVAVAAPSGPGLTNHVNVPAMVKFQVVDPGLGDTAKGFVGGQLKGGVRPLLDWTTEFVERESLEPEEVGARARRPYDSA